MKKNPAILLLLAAALSFGFLEFVFDEAHKGNEAFARGRYDQAAKHYTEAQINDPANPRLDLNLGAALYKQEKLDDAATDEGIPAVETLLAEGFNLETARTAAAIVVAGKSIMASEAGLMDKINYAFDCMTNLCPNATIHRGIYEDARDSLRIYTIISGLKMPTDRIAQLKKEE